MIYEDITGAELHEASDGELAALADGSVDATWFTRACAISELERRRIELDVLATAQPFQTDRATV